MQERGPRKALMPQESMISRVLGNTSVGRAGENPAITFIIYE